MVEGNKALPYGVIKLVRACFCRLGLYVFFDRRKEKGVPQGFVIEFVCIKGITNYGTIGLEDGILGLATPLLRLRFRDRL